jgi:hypothetical protein
VKQIGKTAALILIMAGWVTTITVEEWRLQRASTQAKQLRIRVSAMSDVTALTVVTRQADDFHDMCIAGLGQRGSSIAGNCERIEVSRDGLHKKLLDAQLLAAKEGATLRDLNCISCE